MTRLIFNFLFVIAFLACQTDEQKAKKGVSDLRESNIDHSSAKENQKDTSADTSYWYRTKYCFKDGSCTKYMKTDSELSNALLDACSEKRNINVIKGLL